MQVPIEMSTFDEISINFGIISSYVRLPAIQANQEGWRFQPHGAGLTLQNSPVVGNILSDPTIFFLDLAAAFIEWLCIFRGYKMTVLQVIHWSVATVFFIQPCFSIFNYEEN